MTRVVAAIDRSGAMRPVLAAAEVVAAVYEGEIDAIHVVEPGAPCPDLARRAGRPVRCVEGRVTEAIIEAIAPEDVLIAVMGAREHPPVGREPAGHVALDVAVRVEKPLVLVPPEWDPASLTDRLRLLLPLDGTEECTITVRAFVNRIARTDADIVVLHVFDAATAPAFLDRPEHDLAVWGQEFLTRHCTQPGSRLTVRLGPAGPGIAETAETEGVDAVILGWHQELAPGRAAAVREVLSRAQVPVVLVPRIAAERALAVTAAGRGV